MLHYYQMHTETKGREMRKCCLNLHWEQPHYFDPFLFSIHVYMRRPSRLLFRDWQLGTSPLRIIWLCSQWLLLNCLFAVSRGARLPHIFFHESCNFKTVHPLSRQPACDWHLSVKGLLTSLLAFCIYTKELLQWWAVGSLTEPKQT